MTKKDYILIAKTIADTMIAANLDTDQSEVLVKNFKTSLYLENNRFDQVKFSKYIDKQLDLIHDEFVKDQEN